MKFYHYKLPIMVDDDRFKLSIVSLVFLSCSISFAQQTQVVEIDNLTKLAKKELPFDQNFILKIKDVKDSIISSVFIYEVFVYENDRHLRKKNTTGRIQALQRPGFKYEDGNLFIFMAPLDPHKYVDIVIVREFQKEKFQKLLEVNRELVMGNEVKAKSIFSLLTNVDILEPQGYDTGTARSFFGAQWDDHWFGYKRFFNSLRPYYDNVTDYDYDIDLQLVTIENLSKMAQIGHSISKNSDELSELFTILFHNLDRNLFNGTLSIKGTNHTKLTNNYDFDSRVENLTISISQLDKLIKHGKNLILSSRKDQRFVQTIVQEIDLLRSALKRNKSKIENESKKILSEISANINLRYGEWFSGGNHFTDMKSAGSSRLIPDFGIAVIAAFGNQQTSFIPRPYVGANINVRPINKEQKFREIPNKTIWHRLSFNLGLSVQELDEEEFEDFFKSMSLLIGANYRITRGIRVSAGPVLLRQVNPNPLISESQLELGMYAGISVDVDLVGSISKVTGKIF